MLCVSGIPTEVGAPTSYEGVDGTVTTHPVSVVHSTSELNKARPFAEFLQVPPKFIEAFKAAQAAKKPLTFYVREQALPGGKHGQWIKRVVSDVVQ